MPRFYRTGSVTNTSTKYRNSIPAYRTLPEPVDIRLVQRPKVTQTKSQHCQPADTQAPCKDRILDTQGFGDLLTEHTCTTQFDPAHTLDIHFRFHAGLGIWEIGGPEPDIGKPYPVIELPQQSQQV